MSWLLAADKTAVIRKNSIEPRIQFYRVYMDFDRHSMNLPGEDKDIEPEPASFIRKMTGKGDSNGCKSRMARSDPLENCPCDCP